MEYHFTTENPFDMGSVVTLISGPESLNCTGVEYLVMSGEEFVNQVFEIRFGWHCSPFREALVIDKLLAVGHEGYFYLYDISQKKSLTAVEMDGYFGHLYFNDNLFYVTSAGTVYCFDKNGRELWRNSTVGIDGVIIEKFEDGKIFGSGEWDPPGDWQDFILEIKDGN